LLQAAQQNIITILLGRGKGEIVSGGRDPDCLDGLSSEMISIFSHRISIIPLLTPRGLSHQKTGRGHFSALHMRLTSSKRC